MECCNIQTVSCKKKNLEGGYFLGSGHFIDRRFIERYFIERRNVLSKDYFLELVHVFYYLLIYRKFTYMGLGEDQEKRELFTSLGFSSSKPHCSSKLIALKNV